MPYEIAPGAVIDSSFQDGLPGVYDIDVTIQSVPLSTPVKQNLDPSTWTNAFAAQGYPNVTCVSVRSSKSTGFRSTNPAADLLDSILGGNPNRDVADLHYTVRVSIGSSDGMDTSGMSGLGAAPAGWALAGIIIGAVAVGFTIISYFTGKNVIVDAVRQISAAIAAAAADLGAGLGEGILYAGLALVAIAFLFKKAGGKAAFKGFGIGG